MPPECCICHKDFTPGIDGGLIYFAKRTTDMEWDRLVEETGMVGHPPYAAWFCKKHYKKAIKYKDLYINDAMEKI